MNPEENAEFHDAFEALFHEALAKDPAVRATFLDKACHGDASLKERIERLIAAHEKADRFLDQPAWSFFLQETGKEASGLEDLRPEPGLPHERLGEFRLIRRLGEGGMGVVYLAVQESLNRQVALKVLRGDRKGSFEAETRFLREGEAVSELNHPHIVTVYGSGEDQGVRFLAMEFVPGRGLNEILFEATSRETKPPLEQTLDWIRKIALALQSAHEHGIIHRDIKPSNIRITPEGRPKLLDFSIARHLDLASLTLTGEFCGTPHYAAPEQVSASKEGIDARTDVYALGVTLYEAATGSVPFQGETTEQVFHQILAREPPRPLKLNPELPRDLETVILTAMDKDPDRRYQTMESFAGDLHRILDNKTILAKPAGMHTKLLRRIKGNPGLSAVMTLALATLVSLAVYLPSYYDQKARNRPLADLRLLSRLQEQGRTLWPARPGKVPQMEAWLTEASALAHRLVDYQEELEALRNESIPQAAPEPEPKVWLFEDESRQSQHDTLTELVQNLKGFADPGHGMLAGVRTLLGFSRTLFQASVENYRKEWDRVIAALANEHDFPQYHGLTIQPLLGLIPLGCDPKTGFFEFVHLQTGQVPERRDDGTLVFGEEQGLVFILVPGGKFKIGARPPDSEHPLGTSNVDPQAREVEGPVHEVTVKPFLISKYEMTQAQWVRFMGYNPSHYGPDCRFGGKQNSLLHPLENVSWEEARRVLGWLGLRLPTEAEWEYAARGGTDTIWWTGNEKESLAGTANLMDLTCRTHQGATEAACEEWLDDGFVVHAPVNSYRPNPFGLHDVCGNSYEWCEDAWHPGYEGAPIDGSPWIDATSKIRVCRNCCWDGAASTCRMAYRIWRDKDYKDCGLGVRPAASLAGFQP
ncbi:MAG: SUMF1/EgtB/PvdO family nonheme iron enzyme [Planctomycetes bacterium]|nr:SUMF1/EgtB/PvdO family nonheme iron enzyme [Planctomycetota bacterium]